MGWGNKAGWGDEVGRGDSDEAGWGNEVGRGGGDEGLQGGVRTTHGGEVAAGKVSSRQPKTVRLLPLPAPPLQNFHSK